MKCLEKDRSRRYETANGLGMDLRRHLIYEPVAARPPSNCCRLQKSIRRNRLTYLFSATISMVLLLGIVVSARQAVRSTHAESLALLSRNAAEGLSNFMLEDFYSELEPSGQFEIIARLARQALAYYDNLPASLRTRETDQNRTMAQARLAAIAARQGDYPVASAMASGALPNFGQLRERGQHSEEIIYGNGLASFAKAVADEMQSEYSADVHSMMAPIRRDIDILKPLATSPKGSCRVKHLYADLLDKLVFIHAPEEVIADEEAFRVLAGLGALDWQDLTAASVYADYADGVARQALHLGALDDGERL